MSKRSRIVLLIVITILLIAAIFSAMSEDSPLKVPSVLVITIVGTLASVAQFTGADIFRKLFRKSTSQHHIISLEDLLQCLTEHHLLVRCAAIGRYPVYQLDTEYWTNLTLDFSRIIQDTIVLDMCADCIRTLLSLPNNNLPFFVIEPLDLGESQSEIRRILEEIVKRIPGQFIGIKEVHKLKKVTVLAGIFSPQIKNFLIQEADYVASAIFLIGPDSHYFSKISGSIPLKTISIISTDTLQKLDRGTRRAILYSN